LEHVLDARHRRLRVLDTPLEHAPERVPEVAVRHEVVGPGGQEVVGVEVGELLRPVPARVAEEHGGNYRLGGCRMLTVMTTPGPTARFEEYLSRRARIGWGGPVTASRVLAQARLEV